MRQAEVYRNGILAGVIEEISYNKYSFTYNNNYFNNSQFPAISLTIPKTQQIHTSQTLFPFFSNMLSEGINRKIQSLHLRIDERDEFGILLATAQTDTIGAITIKPLNNE